MKDTIKIHLKNKSDYTNTYNKSILSYDLSNYLSEETKDINTRKNIKFIISSDFNMTDKKMT